jgi:hypothetical protein
MKYIKTMLGMAVAALLMTSAMAATTPVVDTPQPDLWNLSLAGSGTTTTTSDSETAFGVNLQLGRAVTMLLPAEIGVRQGVNWLSTPDKNAGSWAMDTSLYNNWKLLRVGSVELLAGPHVTLAYGNRSPRWSAGPEAEVRLWMKKDVYTFVRGQYDVDISDNSWKSQDLVRYVVGVGFSF